MCQEAGGQKENKRALDADCAQALDGEMIVVSNTGMRYKRLLLLLSDQEDLIRAQD
jgi:hypothetical protein